MVTFLSTYKEPFDGRWETSWCNAILSKYFVFGQVTQSECSESTMELNQQLSRKG